MFGLMLFSCYYIFFIYLLLDFSPRNNKSTENTQPMQIKILIIYPINKT